MRTQLIRDPSSTGYARSRQPFLLRRGAAHDLPEHIGIMLPQLRRAIDDRSLLGHAPGRPDDRPALARGIDDVAIESADPW